MHGPVPFIDLSLLQQGGNGRAQFTAELGLAFERIGFAVLVNHGIRQEVIGAAYRAARELFAHPDNELALYETPENGRQTGFAGYQSEHAKDQKVGDLKRFYHIRRELPPGHPRRVDPAYVENIWPNQHAPRFRPVMQGVFRRLDELAFQVGSALNDYLGFESGTVEEMLRDGESLLRVLHYPAITGEVSGIRSAAHEDIDFLTLLIAGTASGLEVKTRDGEWVAVNETPGSIVVNVGDMLQLRTGGKFVSTTHRVVNPDPTDKSERFSMPFFIHPRGDVVLDTANGFTAGEFLQQRLREIGLYGGAKGA